MSDTYTLRVKGLADLNKAFTLAGKQEARAVKQVLGEVAEPVRAEASRRAAEAIKAPGARGRRSARSGRRGKPKDWTQMRIGVSQSLIYVAPLQRGRKSFHDRLRRPNVAGKLMDEAMVPALEAHRGQVERRMEQALDRVLERWGQGG